MRKQTNSTRFTTDAPKTVTDWEAEARRAEVDPGHMERLAHALRRTPTKVQLEVAASLLQRRANKMRGRVVE